MREGTEEHKGRKDREWYDTDGRRGGEDTKAGKKNEEYREKQEGSSLLERPKHLRVGRVERSKSVGKGSEGRETSRLSGRRSMETGKKHLTLVKRDAAGFPCSPSRSLFCSLLSLRLSLSLPLIRRNFHRKFSRAACNTGGSGARRKCECSAVFISAPNEFAGRFACTRTRTPAHTCVGSRRAGFGWLGEELKFSPLALRKEIGMCAPTGFSAFSPPYLFFSASRLHRRELKG